MSAIPLVYLYCDGPECPLLDGGQQPFKVDPLPDETVRVQRKQARNSGWQFSKGKDFCPLCATTKGRGE